MEIIAAYPQHRFLPGAFFSYDAADEVINYLPEALNKTSGKLALLHEISHCELGHFHYQSDLQLYCMEIDAWNLTRKLARKFGLRISHAYVDECLESYNHWLEKRGNCPQCNNFSTQISENYFECFNCGTAWKVSPNPQVRPKRQLI